MKILIDAGHGGHDTGAYDPIDPAQGDMLCTIEGEMAFDIAQRVERLLDGRGHRVHMTRRSTEFISLQTRCDIANRLKADVFVSIHLNAHRDPNVRGVEVFSFPGSIEGAKLRNAVYVEIMDRLPGWKQRGTKEANFHVLRNTRMPAVLVECGFVTNVEEEKELHKPEIRQKFAEGIASGVLAYGEGVS